MTSRLLKTVYVFIIFQLLSFSAYAQMNEQEARQFIKQKVANEKAVGTLYDSSANADGKLYEIPCLLPSVANKYSYFWVSIKRGSGDIHNFGCYNNDSTNKRIVMFIAQDNGGVEKIVPYSTFGIGVVNQAESKCDGYGFQRGTTAYSQCLMNVDAQNNQAAYQRSQQQQQQLKNGAELLRGDGRSSGSSNCYRTPGGPSSLYCQ